LKKHLAIFTEHYRQPVSELSVIAYAEDLSKLTAEQLDAACIRARQSSEFMPVSAAVLKAHEELRSQQMEDRSSYLGPPMIDYPEISQEEREDALKFSEELKKALGPRYIVQEVKNKITVRPSTLSIDEQKRKLREKGFLR
jgi:hypothetical protein